MRLEVRDDSGRAQLVLLNGRDVMGVAHMKWEVYHGIVRSVLSGLIKTMTPCISSSLAEHLWREAQTNAPGADAEIAKQKLLDFGWNQESINQFSQALARTLAAEFTKFLPEHK